MFSPQPISGYVRSPYKRSQEIPKRFGCQARGRGACLTYSPEFRNRAQQTSRASPTCSFCGSSISRRDSSCSGIPPIDDRPHGVFSTRSPRRPNPIGLTVVELLGREGKQLRVRGIDMLDGTPILDIKPYLSSIPPEKLLRGWMTDAETRRAK